MGCSVQRRLVPLPHRCFGNVEGKFYQSQGSRSYDWHLVGRAQGGLDQRVLCNKELCWQTSQSPKRTLLDIITKCFYAGLMQFKIFQGMQLCKNQKRRLYFDLFGIYREVFVSLTAKPSVFFLSPRPHPSPAALWPLHSHDALSISKSNIHGHTHG